MTIKTETRTVEIALRIWRGGWNAGFEPDCFEDLEVNFPIDHPERLDGDWTIISSDADLVSMIDGWQYECAEANAGHDGECLCALSEDEIARGDSWELIVQEVACEKR